jgi:PAS domain S-box-containing protein
MTLQHDPQTQEIQIEEALRESEQMLRGIVEQSYDGIRLVDEEGVILEWNRGNEQIMGLRREKVMGRFLWDILFQLTPDEDKTPTVYERLKSEVLAARTAKHKTCRHARNMQLT